VPQLLADFKLRRFVIGDARPCHDVRPQLCMPHRAWVDFTLSFVSNRTKQLKLDLPKTRTLVGLRTVVPSGHKVEILKAVTLCREVFTKTEIRRGRAVTRMFGVTALRLECVVFPPEDGSPIIAPSNGASVI